MTLYHDIAAKIRDHIDAGVYPPSSRLPGVRRLSQQFGVSVSTVVQAQWQLENSGVLEARPRSGYYVSQRNWPQPDTPAPSQPDTKPTPVTGQELVLQLAQAANQPGFVQLGAAVPDASFMPMRAFQRSMTKVARLHGMRAANYAFPPGLPELLQQIARRMYLAASRVTAGRILITNGCQEALALALQTVAQPGDIIAIESPTFYGLLQAIESLGMKALEIPTDPQTGISLPALELALEQWPVQACVLIPNFGNPLGSLMPDAHKQQLVKLAKRHRLMLIEDDIYGDLGFSHERPRSLHSFDAEGVNVIYCSSFSKTIAQGLRIGWMVLPETYFPRAEYLKYVTNLAAPTLPQLAIADFLAHGSYERHLRQVRNRYAQQVSLFTQAISQYFPAGTKVTQPKGGFVLWVELAEGVDTLQLTQRMLKQKASIAPGQIFSATQKYRNCIRLSCAQPWTEELEIMLKELGGWLQQTQQEPCKQ
ncbi:PLP-dependent aminotransferase family protein [Thiothrix nivea]|uniref:Transcriptional regulator, GntR family n=1 Tax=Thiothrix nivea (strain ATCC 35100 / DSM 5205 / JP2) TaxID=870187 RepID=A0A656HEH0_THINJ|nr:PLP-dependent aminotransferase family protein [Thiothrix nivea]EIJ34807.1 transcriptional regulator, GntR family [Thiothrix nivea DSM 5205]